MRTTIFVVFLLVVASVYINNVAEAQIGIAIVCLGAFGALMQSYTQHLFEKNHNNSNTEHRLVITLASLFMGGALAFLVSLLFLAGLLTGGLFPEITSTKAPYKGAGNALREVQLNTNGDFYKLLAWSFLAGYAQDAVVEKLSSISGSFGKSKDK